MNRAVPLGAMAALLLAGCAATPPAREMVGYVPPSSQPAQRTEKVVRGDADTVWASLRDVLSQQPYTIEHADRAERVIVARFRGDPEQYLDCGSIVTNDGEALAQLSGALPQVALDYKLAKRQVLLKRSLQLDGRVVVSLEPQGADTVVKADTTYVATKVVDFEDRQGQLRRGSRETVTFNSGSRGAFDKGTICQSKGVFEAALLDGVPSDFGGPTIAQADLPSPLPPAAPEEAEPEPVPLAAAPETLSPPPEAAEIEAALDRPEPVADPAAALAAEGGGTPEAAATAAAGGAEIADRIADAVTPEGPPPGDLAAVEPAPGAPPTADVGSVSETASFIDRADAAVLASLDCAGVEQPFCRLLQITAPYRKINVEAGLGLAISVPDGVTSRPAGSELAVNIDLPSFDSYLHLAYVQRDGMVKHLISTSELWPADLGSYVEETGHRLAEPFGLSLVVAVATPTPLFEGPRPEEEPADAYLATLEERLAALRVSSGGRLAVSHLFLNVEAPGGALSSTQ